VQHALRDAGDELRKWVAEGAATHACGSLNGRGQEILVGLLGEAQLNERAAQGRYRRDLYWLHAGRWALFAGFFPHNSCMAAL